jgi:hypothetical protein
MQPTIHRSHPPLPPSDSHKQGGGFNSLLQVVFVIPYPPFPPSLHLNNYSKNNSTTLAK